MQIALKPASYIVAVSGGVDSVALLDMLVKSNKPAVKLVVAHLDHGMRAESADDAQFVKDLANSYSLEFVTNQAKLGSKASEASARQARYLFLLKAKHDHQAQAIVTAHHHDDLLETAILNLLRGTGRRGLSSLQSKPELLRPLLQLSKTELIDYAKQQQLSWREDATNQDQTYLRNHIRHQICPKLSQQDRQTLTKICQRMAGLNQQLDNLLETYLINNSYRRTGQVFQRFWFNMLDHDLAREVVHYWLSQAKTTNYNQAKVDYITCKLKTLKPGRLIQVGPQQTIILTKRSLRLQL